MDTNTGNQDARADESQHRTQAPFQPFAPGPGRVALHRPYEDRMVTGVAAGLGQYLGVDVTIIRIAFVVLTFVGGAGIPLYLAGLLLIPDEGSGQSIAASLSDSLRPRPRDSVEYGDAAPSSPPRAYGLAPRFRGASDQHMRVSDAERRTVTDRLAEHFADGRLDQAEFDERAGRAMSAKTRADLGGLFDDLPETRATAVPGRPQRRHALPALILVLTVAVSLAAAHLVVQATLPWLFLGFLGAALLLTTWGMRHSRSHRNPRQGR